MSIKNAKRTLERRAPNVVRDALILSESGNHQVTTKLLDIYFPGGLERKLKIKNQESVLKLLKEGTITPKESLDLMRVLREAQDIELLPELIAKLEKLEK